MGARRIPADAFEFYVALGEGRSYDAVAKRYSVTKRAVVALAKREDWQARFEKVEARAREVADAKATETIAAMREKHLKILEVVQGKALQALRAMPLQTAYQAVRALAIAIEQERIVRGEPTERTAVEIETRIRQEHERLLLRPGEREDWSDLEAPAG
jgi:hypothetical protein